MEREVIAIDGDGVIFDYSEGYIRAWEKCFGYRPAVVNPAATMVTDKYGVPHLEGDELEHFRSEFSDDFWATLPILEGAEEACRMLHEKYDLAMVTAIQPNHLDARTRNIGDMPFFDIIATPYEGFNRRLDKSPKINAVKKLGAIAFVDDYLPFHRGMPTNIHTALIGSKNAAYDDMQLLLNISSIHSSLLDFAQDFLEN